ncbi:MAG: hypothetical protein WED11_03315, partial [Natronospirillum sp.]
MPLGLLAFIKGWDYNDFSVYIKPLRPIDENSLMWFVCKMAVVWITGALLTGGAFAQAGPEDR